MVLCRVLVWLRRLLRFDRLAHARCRDRIERLAAWGYELRRPHADYLRDGIFELRAHSGRTQFRILYFFHGPAAVLTHALTKEAAVPPFDIERARQRKRVFEGNPQAHSHEE